MILINSLLPYLFIISSLPFIFFLIHKALPQSFRPLLICYSFLIAPLYVGIIYNCLLFVIPGKSSYIFILLLVILIIVPTVYLSMSRRYQIPSFPTFKITPSFNVVEKIMLVTIMFIVISTVFRTIFWPVTWGDQMLYLQQSYVYGQTRSTTPFYLQDLYHDNFLKFKMISAIRPSLPIIFSLPYLFSLKPYSNLYYSQSIIACEFLVFLFLLYFSSLNYFKNRTASIFSVFLTSTCFYFVNFTIYGFKEIIIISLMLAFFNIVHYLNNYGLTFKILFLIGVVLGLMTEVNYSGTIISVLLLASAFFTLKSNLSQKILFIVVISIVATLSGFLESVTFFQWVREGIDPPKNLQTVSTVIPTIIPITNQTNITPLAPIKNAATTELKGYKINNTLFEYLVKGKFQGLFQIQFYGLVFILLAFVLIAQAKKLIHQDCLPIILLFMLFYFFIILDPFSLNPNKYAYILSISPKYTLILLPLASIIIASRYTFLLKLLSNINYKVVTILSSIGILTTSLVYFRYLPVISLFLQQIVPSYRDSSYYLHILQTITVISFFLFTSILLTIIFTFIKQGESNLQDSWNHLHISFILVILIPFIFLFAIPFQTNYGILETFSQLFSSDETKFVSQKGNEDTNTAITFLAHNIIINEFHKLLTYNFDSNLIHFRTLVHPNNIVQIDKLSTDKSELVPFIREMQVSTVIATKKYFPTPYPKYLTPIYSLGNNIIFSVNYEVF